MGKIFGWRKAGERPSGGTSGGRGGDLPWELLARFDFGLPQRFLNIGRVEVVCISEHSMSS